MFLSSFSHSPFSGMPKGTQKPHSRRKSGDLAAALFRQCLRACPLFSYITSTKGFAFELDLKMENSL